jgi:hypothetical protein
VKTAIISFLCGAICGALTLHLAIIIYYGKGRYHG